MLICRFFLQFRILQNIPVFLNFAALYPKNVHDCPRRVKRCHSHVHPDEVIFCHGSFKVNLLRSFRNTFDKGAKSFPPFSGVRIVLDIVFVEVLFQICEIMIPQNFLVGFQNESFIRFGIVWGTFCAICAVSFTVCATWLLFDLTRQNILEGKYLKI